MIKKNIKRVLGLSLALGVLISGADASARVIGYVTESNGVKYEYSQEDLIESIIEKTELYERYRGESLVALNDDKNGYIDASDVIGAIIDAAIRGERFVVDRYTESEVARVIELEDVKRLSASGQVIPSDKTDLEISELYDESGNLVYMGEILDGLPHGWGKAFYESGAMLYDGQWIGGESSGQGKLFFEDGGLWYKGQWKDDYAHGIGTEYYPSGGILYDGQWKRGEPNGQGTLYYESGSKEYVGQWKDDFFHGQGTWYHEDGTVRFSGEFNYGEAVR